MMVQFVACMKGKQEMGAGTPILAIPPVYVPLFAAGFLFARHGR